MKELPRPCMCEWPEGCTELACMRFTVVMGMQTLITAKYCYRHGELARQAAPRVSHQLAQRTRGVQCFSGSCPRPADAQLFIGGAAGDWYSLCAICAEKIGRNLEIMTRQRPRVRELPNLFRSAPVVITEDLPVG